MDSHPVISVIYPDDVSSLPSQSSRASNAFHASTESINALKRPASPSFHAVSSVGMTRKRIRIESSDQSDEIADLDPYSREDRASDSGSTMHASPDKGKGKELGGEMEPTFGLADQLSEELRCGCCTELCYNVSHQLNFVRAGV